MIRQIKMLLKVRRLGSLIKRRNYCSTVQKCTVATAIDKWENIFKKVNISEPDLSIRFILAHLLKLPRIGDLSSLSSNELTTTQIAELEKYCRCRLSHMPVQYIIGEWEFHDLKIRTVPPVFIPRPETEELVGIIINEIKKSTKPRLKILEIGCGSGVISLSLLKSLPQVECIAVDQSKFACDLTLQNFKLNNLDDKRLQIHHGRLTSNGISDLNFESQVDFVVSNPPYVEENTLPNLSPEIILYEDLKSLNGGEDGFLTIKDILHFTPEVLHQDGKLFLETDTKHPQMIKEYLKKTGSKLHVEQVHCDFTKRQRFVELCYK